VSNSSFSEDNNFSGLTVVRKNTITGGPETASPTDVCNSSDTLAVFYSADTCGQDSNYTPFEGGLTLTLSGGSWDGMPLYRLSFKRINGNLAVWNFSTTSSSSSHEYATLFSPDGINWKIHLGKFDGSSKSYLLAEFVFENRSSDSFDTVFTKTNKSFVSIDGERSSGDVSIVISKT
jgi:hypothetical protein